MSDHAALANELFAAYLDGNTRLNAPSLRDAAFSMDDAYAVESAVAQLHAGRSARAAGVKVGYANKAMWRVLKLDTLVWAHMFDDTVHYATASSATLKLPYYRAPKIEPEIVFKMKQPILQQSSAAGVDAATALASVDWLALGFEIIDNPFTAPQFAPVDFVAAWGLHLALVIGEPLQITPTHIRDLTDALAKFKLQLLKDGVPVEEGGGRNSLRSPALCLAELASAMSRRGKPLAAGDLVSSGTLTSGSPVASGESWTASVDGLPLPALTLRLA